MRSFKVLVQDETAASKKYFKILTPGATAGKSHLRTPARTPAELRSRDVDGWGLVLRHEELTRRCKTAAKRCLSLSYVSHVSAVLDWNESTVPSTVAGLILIYHSFAINCREHLTIVLE